MMEITYQSAGNHHVLLDRIFNALVQQMERSNNYKTRIHAATALAGKYDDSLAHTHTHTHTRIL